MSQIFSYQSHQVRTHTENNQTMFVAKDVCAALSISWSGSKILNGIPEAWKGVAKFTTPRGGSQKFVTITEPAVYKLAFRSNKPEADAFTNWVASEVLPSIRKTGSFGKAKTKQASLPTAPALPSDERRMEEIVAQMQSYLSTVLYLNMDLFDLVCSHRRNLRMEGRDLELPLRDSMNNSFDSVRTGVEALRHMARAVLAAERI